MAPKPNATVKVFISQVQSALRSSTRPTPIIQGIDCSRLWVQGIVVETYGMECLVDDGTGVILVDMKVFLKNMPQGVGGKGPGVGEFIMIIGPLHKKQYGQEESQPLRLLAHQIVTLDTKTQREAVWFLEVIEYWTAVVTQ